MHAVIHDPGLLSELQHLQHELELRDNAGNLLGYFLPPSASRIVHPLGTITCH